MIEMDEMDYTNSMASINDGNQISYDGISPMNHFGTKKNQAIKNMKSLTVNKIEGFMTINNKRFYLVHWNGYDKPDEMTWEVESKVKKYKREISEFWERNQEIHFPSESSTSTSASSTMSSTNLSEVEMSDAYEESNDNTQINDCCEEIRENDFDCLPDFIVDDRDINSKKQFLIRWVGFNEEKDSWMDECQVSSRLIQEYKLVKCSPNIKQKRVTISNNRNSHQYHVLLSNGQLVWLSEAQIDPKILSEYKKANHLM